MMFNDWAVYRVVNIHVIDTLGVAGEDVHQCIECWCTDERHKLHGKHGGGSCCSETLCPTADDTVHTYFLQFNVTYRYALSPDYQIVSSTSLLMMSCCIVCITCS